MSIAMRLMKKVREKIASMSKEEYYEMKQEMETEEMVKSLSTGKIMLPFPETQIQPKQDDYKRHEANASAGETEYALAA